ncbi:hypothetical protein M153_2890003, partial [Pseudoloma neurophilia]
FVLNFNFSYSSDAKRHWKNSDIEFPKMYNCLKLKKIPRST